jgi:double-stranded uracil-DNA glycosylase
VPERRAAEERSIVTPRPLSRRPTASELAAFDGGVVDDLIGPGLRLLFVGINPGLWTAAVNAHFARPGNRFWPALHQAGILPTVVDASAGMSTVDASKVLASGIGITNLVPYASARASHLTREQLRAGGRRLMALVEATRPPVVAVLGLTAFRVAFDRQATRPGRQDETIGAAELWVLPNPSGLNAHETVATLARSYRQAALVAGLSLDNI